MTDLAALIEKLEKATEGSRDLDYAIAEALGRENVRAMQSSFAPWKYTTSLDAALTLVPMGMDYTLQSRNNYAVIADWSSGTSGIPHGTAIAKTLPLALCIAALKARAS